MSVTEATNALMDNEVRQSDIYWCKIVSEVIALN